MVSIEFMMSFKSEFAMMCSNVRVCFIKIKFQVSNFISLSLSDVPSPPGQPKVQDLQAGNSAVVTWDRCDTGLDRVFRLQMCRIATGHWQTVRDGLTECLCIVDCLVQGETYSFRVLSHAPGTIPGFVL